MWVTKEQIASAKQIDLLSYLMQYEPNNLKKLCKETYCTVEHDSLKISNGKWHWFSRHIGGKNALDYLMKVKGVSFTEAVNILAVGHAPVIPNYMAKSEPVKWEFKMPPLHTDIERVKAYLMNRGINEKLIDYLWKQGFLYEDATKYHNCVFIGRDDNGKARYGAIRGISSDFKGDVSGSDKRYSFKISVNNNADTVHLFEAVIDLLSYVTLEIKNCREWYRDDFLSLAGVYVTENKQDIPLALRAYLENHPNIKTLCLHLDNDEVGRKATEQIISALKGQYTVIDQPPKSGKDYNDYLKNELEKQRNKECVR